MTQMAPPLPATAAPKPVVGVGIVIVRPGPVEPEVLLIRRGKPPSAGKWNIPGGHLEFGETVRAAAIREAFEETNLRIVNPRLIDVVDIVSPRSDGTGAHWTLVDFRADWQGDTATAGSDAAAVAWVALSALSSYCLWDETLRIIRAGAAMP